MDKSTVLSELESLDFFRFAGSGDLAPTLLPKDAWKITKGDPNNWLCGAERCSNKTLITNLDSGNLYFVFRYKYNDADGEEIFQKSVVLPAYKLGEHP